MKDYITAFNRPRMAPEWGETAFGFSVRREGSEVLLELRGEFDFSVSEPVYSALSDAFLDAGCMDLIADMTSLTFLDSTGLGMFLKALNPVKARGGSIYIAGCRPSIRRGFAVTGLDRTFHVYDTLAEIHLIRLVGTDHSA